MLKLAKGLLHILYILARSGGATRFATSPVVSGDRHFMAPSWINRQNMPGDRAMRLQGEEHAHRPPLLERREAIEAGRSKTVAETKRAMRRSGRRAASVPEGTASCACSLLYTALRCKRHIFSKSPWGVATLGERVYRMSRMSRIGVQNGDVFYGRRPTRPCEHTLWLRTTLESGPERPRPALTYSVRVRWV